LRTLAAAEAGPSPAGNHLEVAERRSFLAELKHRNVWRAAVLYAGAVWVVSQGIAQLSPALGLPDWATRAFLVAAALGLPFWIAFTWVYEITPQGIKRESDIPRDASIAHDTGRKLDFAIIAVLAVAVLLLLGNQFLWHKGVRRTASPVASTTGAAAPGKTLPPSTAAVPEKSVAVLPFENDSGQKDQQYFSDGLSQDLITALTQFTGLKVISRDSAFQFRGSKDSPAVIAARLGVAHLLEGAVQRQDDQVRISVTLVNANDGSTLWSRHYDRPYKDLFALQDAITQSVANELKAKLLTAPGAVVQSERPPSGNLKAWQAYQQGRFYHAIITQADDRRAIDALVTATRIDPGYAAAYARASFDWTGLAGQYLAGAAQREAYAKAREAADKALALQPDLALAHGALGWLLLKADFDWMGAQAQFQRAAELAPNDAEVLFDLGIMQETLGRVQSAVELTRKALAANPLHVAWYGWLSNYLVGLGKWDAAQQAITKAIELQPGADSSHTGLAVIAILRGDAKAALAAAQKESDPGWRRIALALATQIGPDRKAADAAIHTLIAEQAEASPFQIAEVYALRRDPDNMFKWLDHAWFDRDSGLHNLLSNPFILRYHDDPRFAAFCKKVGLPTTTDAVAMP
jgi:TolB-like protein/Flp pilus assembly protein TadD